MNSGGYFTYDVVGMKVFGLLKWDMFIHHTLCIVGIVVVLLEGHDTCHVVAGLFVAEVSNPAMHVRTMLRNLGLRYTWVHDTAEILYFFMFFFGRVIVGHPVVYETVTCESMHWIAKFVSLGVLAQSYQFLYRMGVLLVARVREINERNQKNIKIGWLTPIDEEDLKKCTFYKKRTQDKLP